MFLPTGGGKTVCFAQLAMDFEREFNKSVLVLVHRVELLKQAAETFRKMTKADPCLITSKSSEFKFARVYIGMVESTMSRLHLLHNVGMVIIDECHIQNFNKVHEIFKNEYIVGVTATPKSASKKDPLKNYYKCIVCGPQISELIDLGFLAQNVTRCPKDIVDATKFEIDRMKGDYNERQMSDEYRLPHHVVNVVKNYDRFCLGGKTLVFNVTIEHSKKVNDMFVLCGYNSRHLDSNCSEQERADMIQWFKETEDAILNNVMIATVGFDEPTIKNIILNFSTLSLVKYIQCAGRGGRVVDDEFINRFQADYPYELEQKNYFNIIDMGGNCIKFGDWNDDRDWEYIFDNPDLPGNGVAPVKTCPQCEGLVHAATMICPLQDEHGDFCGYQFQRKKRMEEQDMEEVILITKGIDIDKLIGKHRKKYEYYTFFELGVDVVKLMIEKYGRNPSENTVNRYFKIYYRLCINWYNKTLAHLEDHMEDISDSAWHIKRAKINFNNLIKKHGGNTFSSPEIVYDWDKEIQEF